MPVTLLGADDSYNGSSGSVGTIVGGVIGGIVVVIIVVIIILVIYFFRLYKNKGNVK